MTLPNAITQHHVTHENKRTQALQVLIGTGSTQAHRIVAERHLVAMSRRNAKVSAVLNKAKGSNQQ